MLVTMFVIEKVVTTFGGEPEATTLAMASTAAWRKVHSCSSAETSALTLPGNASSVMTAEVEPFVGLKSLKVLGEVTVMVRLRPSHTRPSKTAMLVPSCVALMVVNTAPSQDM